MVYALAPLYRAREPKQRHLCTHGAHKCIAEAVDIVRGICSMALEKKKLLWALTTLPTAPGTGLCSENTSF